MTGPHPSLISLAVLRVTAVKMKFTFRLFSQCSPLLILALPAHYKQMLFFQDLKLVRVPVSINQFLSTLLKLISFLSDVQFFLSNISCAANVCCERNCNTGH